MVKTIVSCRFSLKPGHSVVVSLSKYRVLVSSLSRQNSTCDNSWCFWIDSNSPRTKAIWGWFPISKAPIQVTSGHEVVLNNSRTPGYVSVWSICRETCRDHKFQIGSPNKVTRRIISQNLARFSVKSLALISNEWMQAMKPWNRFGIKWRCISSKTTVRWMCVRDPGTFLHCWNSLLYHTHL